VLLRKMLERLASFLGEENMTPSIEITAGTLQLTAYRVFYSFQRRVNLILENGEPWPPFVDPETAILLYTGHCTSEDAAQIASRF
jgi:hypothetical protein